MKKIITLCLLCAFVGNLQAQKPKTPKATTADDMKAIMKQAGMSKEEMKMVKEVMGANINKPSTQSAANGEELFTKNSQLIPAKNAAKIASIKNNYSNAEATAAINNLYTKLLAKGDAKQIAMAKKAMQVATTPTALLDASTTAMLSAQQHTALLLALKAAQQNPINAVAINNVAALLTQYGYPEQAIPFLQKLQKENPFNSSILNNLAFAWLALGDAEKAYQYAFGSVMANPKHPQSRAVIAVVLEKEGKTTEAKKQIEIAQKHNGTAMVDKIKKNNGGENFTNFISTMSWEDIKKKISVYEYFPKGWRKTFVPTQNNLDYHLQFFADFGSDQKMRTAFAKKVNELQKAKDKLSDATMNDPSQIMKTAIKMGTANGNVMLMANRVTATISTAFAKEKKDNWDKKLEGLQELKKWVERGDFKTTQKMKCPEMKDIIDPENTNRIQMYNPKLLAFVEELEEEYRFYYNAMVTWTLLQSTAITKDHAEADAYGLIKEYGSNVDAFSLYWKFYHPGPMDCAKGGGQVQDVPEYNLPMPEIPKLDCPIVFTVPSGFGSITNGSNGFGAANDYGITPNGATPMPNMTASFSTNGNTVGNAGVNNDPHINASPTGAEPALGNTNATADDDDDDVQPLSEIPPKPSAVNNNWDDDIVPLTPIQTDKQKQAQRKAAQKATKELIHANSSKNCNEQLTKNEKRWKKFREAAEKLDATLDAEEAFAKAELKRKQKLYDAAQDDDIVPLTKIPQKDLVQKPTITESDISKFYSNVKAAVKEAITNNGLTTTLNNGFTIPDKVAGYVSGLFD